MSDSDGPRYLPGDPTLDIDAARMIRVDHAGEDCACWIYRGQLAVLGRSEAAPTLQRMAAQEAAHLEAFSALVIARRVRPSALSPLWRLAGWTLGAGSALLGEKMAMACTVAVEDVIDAHYAAQRDRLRRQDQEPALAAMIETFRIEEVEHGAMATAHGATDAVGAPVLMAAIRSGARLAIRLAERI